MSVDDWDLGDFFEGEGEQDPFGDKKLQRELVDIPSATPNGGVEEVG